MVLAPARPDGRAYVWQSTDAPLQAMAWSLLRRQNGAYLQGKMGAWVFRLAIASWSFLALFVSHLRCRPIGGPVSQSACFSASI